MSAVDEAKGRELLAKLETGKYLREYILVELPDLLRAAYAEIDTLRDFKTRVGKDGAERSQLIDDLREDLAEANARIDAALKHVDMALYAGNDSRDLGRIDNLLASVNAARAALTAQQTSKETTK